MAKKTLNDLRTEANQRLKLLNCPLKLSPQDDRIYLRGTLPPKPNSGKEKPFQQRIPANVYFNPAGIQEAEELAQKIHYELKNGQFSWATYLKSAQQPTTERRLTIEQVVADFEEAYFTDRERNPKSQTTWAKDYKTPFNRLLPVDAELTADVLISAVKEYYPDTRSRQRACTAYTALAKFAGLEVDLQKLKGNYHPTKVKRENVPTDELILEWSDLIPDPKWQTFYRLVACYGLRNHEAFYIDLEQLKTDPIAIVRDGKTGYRVALPCPLGWWESWFKQIPLALPTLKASTNSAYGNKSSQYFRRLDLPFHIYDLRHAHAGRLAMKGIDPAIAARSQGHSLKVHSDIYLNFLGAEQLRGLLDNLK